MYIQNFFHWIIFKYKFYRYLVSQQLKMVIAGATFSVIIITILHFGLAEKGDNV